MPQDALEFLKAIASETRLRILMLFMQHEELTVGQIAEACGIGQSTASQNVAQLRRAGLLVSRREGKETFCRTDRRRIAAQLEELARFMRTCC